jgi:hypothetical protein
VCKYCRLLVRLRMPGVDMDSTRARLGTMDLTHQRLPEDNNIAPPETCMPGLVGLGMELR